MSTIPAIELSRLRLPELSDELKSKLFAHAELPTLVRAFINTILKREEILRDEINQAGRSVLLATAIGREIDQLAALYGIKRLLISPAEPESSPPKVAVMESDDRLRLRTRLSLESRSQSGCKGAYLFHALSASAHIKDISVFNDDIKPEKINIVVLSDQGKGDGKSGDEYVLKNVKQAMAGVSSVTDDVSVQWAKIVAFSVQAEIQIKAGEAADGIYQKIKEKVEELLKANHRLGKNVLRNEFFSVMYQPGVESVRLLQPAKDIAIGIDSAPFNAADEAESETFQIIIQPVPDISFVFQLPDFYRLAIRGPQIVRLAASITGQKNVDR